MAEIKNPGSADTQLVGTPPANVGAAVTTIAGTTPVKSENLSSADQSSVFGDGSSQRPLSSSGGGGYSLDVLEDGDLIASGVTALDFTGSGVSLTNAGSGQVTINIPSSGGGGIGGGGTLNRVAKFTPDGTTVGDSQIIDDGALVNVNAATTLTLTGGTGASLLTSAGPITISGAALVSIGTPQDVSISGNSSVTITSGAGTIDINSLSNIIIDSVVKTIISNNAAHPVGFYGAAGTVKQVGVAVTTAAIHAALVTLGLIAA